MTRRAAFGLSTVTLLAMAGSAMAGFPAPRPKVDLAAVPLEILIYDGPRPGRTVSVGAGHAYSRELAKVVEGGSWQLSFTSYVPSSLARPRPDDGRFSVNVMGSKVVVNQPGAFQKVRELSPAEHARLMALLPAR